MNKKLFLADTTTMITRFLIYGTVGWCLEIFWTGLLAGFKGNKTLSGSTSLWMFPIYGMVVFLEPFFVLFGGLPFFVRGVAYMLFIFGAEYISGLTLLGTVGVCPWDYSHAKLNIAGVIRLDYAPVWFGVGLFYEWLFKVLITLL